MAKGWSMEVAIEFCTYYLYINKVGVPESCHEGRLGGKGTIGRKSCIVKDSMSFTQAQSAILQQSNEVMPYNEEHFQLLQTLFLNRSQAWVHKKHKA
jgi:hypothetical protein